MDSIPTEIQFSVLKHDVPVGKVFSYNPDGTLCSETNGRLESATSHLTKISSIHELEHIITIASGYEHLVSGVSGHNQPVGVYPGARYEGSIARDNKHYKQPKGAGILVIDSDNITESIRDKLIDICQGIAGVEMLETTSSSSLIYDKTGWLRGFTGTHTFVAIKDATDVKRTLQVLHKRAILEGYGQHRISAVGGFLERSFIDTMLDKPSQPIYLKPNLAPGIFQDKKIVKYDGETLFDSRKYVKNLTEAEEETYQAMIQCSQFELQSECALKRAEWVSKQPNPDTAEKALQTKTLDGAFVIDTAHVGSATVHDILMNPGRYDRMTCRDPFYDDEYNSKTIAMIFTDQDRAMINSHAHGGVTYQLLDPTMVGFGVDRVPVGDLYPDADFGGALPLQPSLLDTPAPDVIGHVEPVVSTGALEFQQASPEPVEQSDDLIQDTDLFLPEKRYDTIVPIQPSEWIGDHCSSQGKPRTTFPIFKHMVHSYGINIGYDVIGKKTLMLGQGIHIKGDLKANANHGMLHNLCKLNQIDTGSIDPFINMMMMENEINPVTNWVGSKPWDGEHRIRPLFDTLYIIR